MKRIVIGIYIDVDFFPPSINAILNFAEVFEEVIVVSRNNSKSDFPFPKNVRLIKVGPFCTVREMEQQSVWQKAFYFSKFARTLLKYAKKGEADMLVLYDSLALFAYYLTRKFSHSKKVWYHNHDMADSRLLGKLSIGGLAAKYESKALNYIHIFSLPSKERMVYFPDLPLGVANFVIPNYPSLKIYSKPTKNGDSYLVNLIYQGFIGAGHSLESFIKLLSASINGRQLHLILKGAVSEEYKSSLNTLAEREGVMDRITWLPVGPYSELPAITSKADIGIGINYNTDAVSLAQGSASNKIYEYAASGLPVILYDSEQFRTYLEKYEWAFFSDGSKDSLVKIITAIIPKLESYRKMARNDFEKELNFEYVFKPVLKSLQLISNG